MRHVVAGILSSAFVCFVSVDARSEPSGQEVALAQALFEEGKRLMAAKNFAEACPKLTESQRLDPAGGTTLALGLCHEGEGKTATAWADFNQAATEARRDRRPDREGLAVDRLRALETKLTKVRLLAPKGIDGLEIHRNGTPVGPPQWGVPLPVDPGELTFEAHAPKKKSWKATIAVAGEGRTVDVAIPPLPDAPREIEAPRAAPPRPIEPPSSNQKTLAWIAGGTGVVLTSVGIVFGLTATAKWSDARTARSNELGRDAGTLADVSTTTFTLGAIALAASVVLFLTAPSSNQATLTGGLR